LAHLYFYSDHPFKKKSSDVVKFKDKIENKIPETYLIIMGLILLVILSPEIKTAKIVFLEFELAKDPYPLK
jgi:hypothetical protein